jgi:hypothetical protein
MEQSNIDKFIAWFDRNESFFTTQQRLQLIDSLIKQLPMGKETECEAALVHVMQNVLYLLSSYNAIQHIQEECSKQLHSLYENQNKELLKLQQHGK